MTTIYVCESGCKYEGGSAFAASTSLVSAWRLMRKQMIEHAEYMRRMRIRGHIKLEGKMYWEHGSEYFQIRKFDDLKDTL